MTAEEREQWAKDAERINIPRMLDVPCGQIAGNAHLKVLNWYLQKGEELGLSGKGDPAGDSQEAVLERFKEYIATTPPAMRCPCKKGVALAKAGQHLSYCDARPALIRKERELKRVVEEERVLKVQRLDIEERFQWAKVGAQGFEASWRDTYPAHLTTAFLQRLKAAVAKELETRYIGFVSHFEFPFILIPPPIPTPIPTHTHTHTHTQTDTHTIPIRYKNLYHFICSDHEDPSDEDDE